MNSISFENMISKVLNTPIPVYLSVVYNSLPIPITRFIIKLKIVLIAEAIKLIMLFIKVPMKFKTLFTIYLLYSFSIIKYNISVFRFKPLFYKNV